MTKTYEVIRWPNQGGKQWLVEVTQGGINPTYFPMLQMEGREDGRTAEEIITTGLTKHFNDVLKGGH